MGHLVEANNICINYGEKRVVYDASFTLEEGEVLAIVGESGSGKSTILKALLQIPGFGVTLKEGALFFDSKNMLDLTKAQVKQLRGKEMGAIFQNPGAALNPIRKIGIQFLETMNSHGKISKKEAYAKILDIFKNLNLQNGERILASFPYQLSGGMNQRVAIALAMIMRPKLLLADEPTSALDVTTQAQVVEELLKLKNEFKTSMIIVTHNMGVAAKLADKTAIMYQGRIVDYGPSKEILKNPKDEYSRKLLQAIPKLVTDRYETTDEKRKVVMEVRGLSKTYGKGRNSFQALKPVSFDVREGEIIGIVGESGSGKSTIAKQIIRLERPSSGTVTMGNLLLSHMLSTDLKYIYMQVQMVFQNAIGSFDSHMKIRESISEAIRNITKEKNKKIINEKIDALMIKVGLIPEMADRFPHELSGGQCQRAAIARAISVNPKILICDEATSALDVSAQAQVVKLLQQLGREMNIAIVFICHDLALVSDMCQHVVVMKNGICVESGRTGEVIRNTENGYTKNLLNSILTID